MNRHDTRLEQIEHVDIAIENDFIFDHEDEIRNNF
jgi:hypothetical protein